MQLEKKESDIQKEICEFLSHQSGFKFWLNKTTGVFTKGVYRKRNSKYDCLGVSDIVGCWQGRFVAIEIKTPKGPIRPAQIEFISEINKLGGLAFVARSVEDVVKHFIKPTSSPQSCEG